MARYSEKYETLLEAICDYQTYMNETSWDEDEVECDMELPPGISWEFLNSMEDGRDDDQRPANMRYDSEEEDD